MKKLLVVFMTLLLVCGCSSKKEEVQEEVKDDVQEEVKEEVKEEAQEEKNEIMAGGWSINADLPAMNDEIFNNALQNDSSEEYQPIVLLGTQVVAGENLMYLTYTDTALKVVTVFNELGNTGNAQITNAVDFNLLDYLDDYGETTPEGMMGGWQDNSEQPNLLSQEEKEVFDKAQAKLMGMAYVPIATLATQVVAGTNYAFLATTTEDYEVRHLYVIKVYADLQGNAEVTNECGINLLDFTK